MISDTRLVVIVALLAAMTGTAKYIDVNHAESLGEELLPSFSSYSELVGFLDIARESGGNFDVFLEGTVFFPATPMTTRMAYSTTNVQVEGIDEEDIVKTDGEFLYLASSDRVTIVKAYPPGDMGNVSKIESRDLQGDDGEGKDVWIVGIYLYSGRLAVISVAYEARNITLDIYPQTTVAWTPSEPSTAISIFDLRDIAEPSLLSYHEVSGQFLTSRMVGGYVYILSQSYIWKLVDEYNVPELCEGPECDDFQVNKIRYDPESQDPSYYLSILAVDVNTMDFDYTSIISGYASTVYMSSEALYLTFQKWKGEVARSEPILFSTRSYAVTTIYKVLVDGLSMQIAARGEVLGSLLNQFSMDERPPHLRVATTTSWTAPENNVYVLDENLNIVGALEGLAPSERIYSARFLGDALYLVTFRQVDPFFVIDLSDPQRPKVLGELKIPGFSSYLHPVDDTHVLGIGSENSSVKISLFNVSNPVEPVEADRYSIGKLSDSPAIWDHKAVLFDRDMELLVIPVTVWDDYGWDSASSAYVFRVSTKDGIALRGIIGHGSANVLQRSLYIDDYLYTISTSMVKANSLADLSEVNSLVYRMWQWEPIRELKVQ